MSTILRQKYNFVNLFAAIGVNYGNGDGVNTFNVPDMREAAPVGTGTRGSGVTYHDIYTLGQFKDDQLLNHGHSVTDPGHKHWQADGGGTVPNPNPEEIEMKSGTNVWSVYPAASQFSFTTGKSVTGISVGNPNNNNRGDVNRGKRIGVNYIIKY